MRKTHDRISRFRILFAVAMLTTILSGCRVESVVPEQETDSSVDSLQSAGDVSPAFGLANGPDNSSAISEDGWQLGGTANTIITVGDTLYVGGDFDEIYHSNGLRLPRTHLAAFDRFTFEAKSFAPVLDGEVVALSASPDGSTVYASGLFWHADGQRRQGIAAFDTISGVLTGFDPPAANGSIEAIEVTMNRVYLGGSFTTIGGEQNAYLAAFDPGSATLDTHFKARPGNEVKGLFAGAEGLWLVGDFSTINGAPQRGIGLVDLESGSLQASDDVDYPVFDLDASDTQVFIAGGDREGRATAFSRMTGNKSWEVASNGSIQAVAVADDSHVYFGGQYNQITGIDMLNLTRHKQSNGALDPNWAHKPNGLRAINAIEVVANSIFVGGDFTRFNAESREGIVQLSNRTGQNIHGLPFATAVSQVANDPLVDQASDDMSELVDLKQIAVSVNRSLDESFVSGSQIVDGYQPADSPAESWQLDGTANVVLTVGGTVYIGGNFTSIHDSNGQRLPRGFFTALNRRTGQPLDFAPMFDDEVWALATSPDKNTLYVGGTFNQVGNRTRRRIAAFDLTNGRLTEFAPPWPSSGLRAIAVTDQRVYLGGYFLRVGAGRRPYLAAFDPTSSALDSAFAAEPNAGVKELIAGPEGLWIGGDFSRISGDYQPGIALVDLASGALAPTDSVEYPVIDLTASQSQIFLAGGGPGGRAAAFSRRTGKKQWEIVSDGNFQAVDVVAGPYVYFGGHYETIEGNRSIDRLTRHDKATGETDLSWLPRINGYRSINAIDVRVNGLYIGGDFTRVNSHRRSGFAMFPSAE